MSGKPPLGSTGSNSTAHSASSSTHVIPPEESLPEEDPPPYTPEAEPGMAVAGMSNIPPYLQQEIANSSQQRPPTQPPRPTHNTYGSGRPSTTSPRPPRPPSSAFPGTNYQSYSQNQSQQYHHRPTPTPPRNPNLPFTYPPGYYCYKCNNTGIKLKNGLTCQDCYGRFAHQSGNVQVVNSGPSYYSPFGSFMGPTTSYVPHHAGAPPPRFVRPGDPSIGGVLCGRCRGRGMISDFFGDETCPTCRGVGRLL